MHFDHNYSPWQFGKFDLRLRLWLRSIFVHSPWIICFGILLWFLMSSQGISLMEYPVEHPWIRFVCFGVVLAVAVAIFQMVDGLHVEVAWLRVGLRPPKFRLIKLLFYMAGSWAVSRAALTNEGLNQYVAIPLTFITVLMVSIAMVYPVDPEDTGFKSTAYFLFLLFLPILLLAGGTYLVIHHMDWLAGLGAFIVVGAGLILLVTAVQSLFLLLPWMGIVPTAVLLLAGCTYLVIHHIGWLVGFGMLIVGAWLIILAKSVQSPKPIPTVGAIIVTAVLLHGCQEPITERSNPLLANIPPNVEPIAGTCSDLIKAGAVTTETQSDAKPRPMFLISAEGGGIRAAYWTAVSLEELSQKRSRPLLEETALLSGVSGGSLGLATWLAAQELPVGARLSCIREYLSSDFFTPLIAGVLFLDIPRLVIPKSILDTHRGDYFESYMAYRWLALTGKPFFYRRLADLSFPGSEARIYFNATDALSGQFIAFGNAAAPLPPGANEKTASTLNSILREHLSDLRVAQAVHMSARFPYLSPNPDVMLPARDAAKTLFNRDDVDDGAPTRVASLVDGGYFDNSALGPALRLLEDQAVSNDEAVKSQPRFILHLFNNQRRNCYSNSKHSGCMRATDESLNELKGFSVWGWLNRPSDAIVAVRDQHSLQRLNELVMAMKNIPSAQRLLLALPMPEAKSDKVLEYLAKVPFHGRDQTWSEVALGWTLSPNEREFIDRQASQVRDEPKPE